LPREQLLDDSGAIRWPVATPGGPSVAEPLRQAEEAVRGVVAQGKQQGRASIRQVIDARTKLASFARVAVPEVKLASAADATRLETFVVELRKTLETMAVRY
jgi:hypothetical protein